MIRCAVSNWDERYLDLAKVVSGWSKDPSTKCGAVIVRPDNRIVSLGYNGFPMGVEDDWRLDDRTLKYEIIAHAEMNALISAAQSVVGCTLYTYPLLSCSRCASLMIQAGIHRNIAPRFDEPRWAENIELSKSLYLEAGVEVVELD